MASHFHPTSATRLQLSLSGLLLLGPLTITSAATETTAQPTPASMQRYLADAYTRVHQSADRLEQVTEKHCSAASGSGKTTVAQKQALEDAFEALGISWSRVAFIRIGPYREGHAGQRMQFWPDKRGSGERQIQQALMTRPEALLQTDSLQQQSVALQGLPAYEAVLEQLDESATDDAARGAFHCRYLATLATSMSTNTGNLAEQMSADSEALGLMTFSQWMEVIRGGLQISGEIKLGAIAQSMRTQLGQLPKAGASAELELTRKVPFSRSHRALASVAAEVAGIAALLNSASIERLLQDNEAGYVASIRFQLAQAEQAIGKLADLEGRAVSPAELEEAITVVDYAGGMLAQAGNDLMTTLYPALGLARGFNSMDGD